jgi:hypothetical protein
MARYLTQDLFDTMAISHVMLRLTPTPELTKMLTVTVESYRRSYPDENFDQLRAELSSAANEVRHVSDEIYDTLFGPDFQNKTGAYFSVLKELNELVLAEARKKQPLLKRVFGGTKFNYERSRPTNRVAKCKEHVSLAAMHILAKQVGALNRMPRG